jgi:hypothetical protein
MLLGALRWPILRRALRIPTRRIAEATMNEVPEEEKAESPEDAGV